jgi:hypothetical protein
MLKGTWNFETGHAAQITSWKNGITKISEQHLRQYLRKTKPRGKWFLWRVPLAGFCMLSVVLQLLVVALIDHAWNIDGWSCTLTKKTINERNELYTPENSPAVCSLLWVFNYTNDDFVWDKWDVGWTSSFSKRGNSHEKVTAQSSLNQFYTLQYYHDVSMILRGGRHLTCALSRWTTSNIPCSEEIYERPSPFVEIQANRVICCRIRQWW